VKIGIVVLHRFLGGAIRVSSQVAHSVISSGANFAVMLIIDQLLALILGSESGCFALSVLAGSL